MKKEMFNTVDDMVEKGVLALGEFEGSGTVILKGKEIDVVAGEPIEIRVFESKNGYKPKDKVTPLRPLTKENIVADYTQLIQRN